jgi:hypothetical protein
MIYALISSSTLSSAEIEHDASLTARREPEVVLFNSDVAI